MINQELIDKGLAECFNELTTAEACRVELYTNQLSVPLDGKAKERTRLVDELFKSLTPEDFVEVARRMRGVIFQMITNTWPLATLQPDGTWGTAEK